MSGADLEYQRMLADAGIDPSGAQGYDAARLEQLGDEVGFSNEVAKAKQQIETTLAEDLADSQSPVGSAISNLIDLELDAQDIPGQVNTAVGSASTVVSAAEIAVSTVASNRTLQPTLFYSKSETTGTATTSSGTPVYTGGALSGGILTLEAPVLDITNDGSNIGDLTAEAIVTITGNPPANRIIAQKIGNWSLGVAANGRAFAYVSYGSTPVQVYNPSGPVITDGNPHHVCLIASGGSAYTFVDGVLMNGLSGTYAVDTADKTITFGGSPTWPGTVQAVRISQDARYSLSGFTSPSSFSFDPSTLLLGEFDDATVRLAIDGPTAYPARPNATSVKWIGPYEPAAMALYDEWIQVTL